MISKKLKELYPVDTLSQDKGWGKVHEALGDLQEDVEIDFSNINVVDPWQCPEFKKLLRDKHVHMVFVNSESMVNRIKMMCIIDGLDETRIVNKVVQLPKEKTPEEKKIENYGRNLIPYFDYENDPERGDTAVLELEKKYSQIQSTNTLSYVDYAIREIHNMQGYDNFVLKLGKLVVLPNVLHVIATMMVQYEKEGFHLLVDCDDEDTQRDMGLFIHNETAHKYNNKERKESIQKELKIGQAGILIKYKKSKALDDFGREGHGEVVSSRVAIYRGLDKNNNGQVAASIEVFSDNYFYTVDQWMVEHDYEVPTSLHSEIVKIPLDELGICDLFLGSKYHFILPIQQKESENRVVIKEVDTNGNNIKVQCTIPERMKIVFDSWGIDYDKPLLEEAIKTTREELEKKRAEKDKSFREGIDQCLLGDTLVKTSAGDKKVGDIKKGDKVLSFTGTEKNEER